MLEMTFMLAQAVPPDAPATGVSIPWGSWISSVLDAAQPIVLLALSGVTTYVMAAFVPPWIRAFAGDATQRRVNQVLEKAVLSGIAQTKDAVAGQRTTVPVASEILARAAQYAVDQAPDLIRAATHGQMESLLRMLMARMEALQVAPPEFDIAEARKGAGFTFEGEIAKQLGK